jgi:hypothetical protein
MAHHIKNPLIPAKAGTQAEFESCSGSHHRRMGLGLRRGERMVGTYL